MHDKPACRYKKPGKGRVYGFGAPVRDAAMPLKGASICSPKRAQSRMKARPAGDCLNIRRFPILSGRFRAPVKSGSCKHMLLVQPQAFYINYTDIPVCGQGVLSKPQNIHPLGPAAERTGTGPGRPGGLWRTCRTAGSRQRTARRFRVGPSFFAQAFPGMASHAS